ncbi:MAG: CxxxxCH/CxxCH domain-containing protein [Bacteroidaceae bacterium]|nr:CxxxxCH/CxxCH domain-containing protein [Bacteroidaceae bacterium]
MVYCHSMVRYSSSPFQTQPSWSS